MGGSTSPAGVMVGCWLVNPTWIHHFDASVFLRNVVSGWHTVASGTHIFLSPPPGTSFPDPPKKSGWWVWNMNFIIFLHIGNFIIPTDEVIFFRGVGQPPTRNSWGVDTNPFDSHLGQTATWRYELLYQQLDGTSVLWSPGGSKWNGGTGIFAKIMAFRNHGLGLMLFFWDFLGMQSWFGRVWEGSQSFLGMQSVMVWSGHSQLETRLGQLLRFPSQLTFSDFCWIHCLDLAVGLVILLPFFPFWWWMNSQWPFFGWQFTSFVFLMSVQTGKSSNREFYLQT